MDTTDYQQRLDFALQLSHTAREVILRYFQDTSLEIEIKGDQSPVTIADRGAEEAMRKQITETYPEDGILGEEFGTLESKNGYRWILDPIDGTKSFVHGVPLFGTLIGLEHNGEMVVGVCAFPGLDEVIYAAQGTGTWWKRGNRDPVQTHVTDVDKLSDALVCYTTITGWHSEHQKNVDRRLCAESRLVRGWGDCYGHALVATGRADLIVEPGMSPWDAAALVPILREAGGHYLNWDGGHSIYADNGLSVNDGLKEEVLAIVKPPE